jgi:raffinose/stachyose/melibiose transport system permease protein
MIPGEKKIPRVNMFTIIALVICLVHIIPFYILIGVAFKRPTDTTSRWLLPTYVYLGNFKDAIVEGKILRSLFSNVLITSCSIAAIVVLGALAAYPLARNMSRLNRCVLAFALAVMMVPPLSILLPLYSLIVDIKASSTYWGIVVILVTFQLPTCIYLYTNFISTIPITLDEAAEMDGCKPLMLFFRIILPQLKAVSASVVIMTGVICWNDYMFALYVLQRPYIKTVTLAIAHFFSQFSNNLGAAAAGALFGILPIIALFMLFQKYFIRGMIDSSIK